MDHELMNKIYDKLADNDSYEQFDHHVDTDNMCIAQDPETNQAFIAWTKGNKEYVLGLTVNEPDEWEVFDPNSGFDI